MGTLNFKPYSSVPKLESLQSNFRSIPDAFEAVPCDRWLRVFMSQGLKRYSNI